MKQLLLLSAIIVASVQLRASHLASELNLRLQHQAWFTLTIDNRCYDTPVNFFHTGNLSPGNHFIQVTRLDHGYYGPLSVETHLFSGYIHIPALSRVHAFIDKNGKLRINNITALAPVPVAPNQCAPVPVTYNGMNEYDFDNLCQTIDRLSFESSRMQVAKQAIASNHLTSRQVSILIKMMTFESSKLDLAKFAYRNTVDKQNYFIINDAFTFESSITELNEFIYSS